MGLSPPHSTSTTPSSPVNWIARIRGCVSRESFLTAVLPELDQYKGTASSVVIFPFISVTETTRGCITLPEELYPKAEREFITVEGNASLGYVSNWDQACNSSQFGPLANNCTGDGYEGGGEAAS